MFVLKPLVDMKTPNFFTYRELSKEEMVDIENIVGRVGEVGGAIGMAYCCEKCTSMIKYKVIYFDGKKIKCSYLCQRHLREMFYCNYFDLSKRIRNVVKSLIKGKMIRVSHKGGKQMIEIFDDKSKSFLKKRTFGIIKGLNIIKQEPDGIWKINENLLK